MQDGQVNKFKGPMFIFKGFYKEKRNKLLEWTSINNGLNMSRVLNIIIVYIQGFGDPITESSFNQSS